MFVRYIHTYVYTVYTYINYTLSMCIRYVHTYVYTVFVRYFCQGFYHLCGHIRCTYMVLANTYEGVSKVKAEWLSQVHALVHSSKLVRGTRSVWCLNCLALLSMVRFAVPIRWCEQSSGRVLCAHATHLHKCCAPTKVYSKFWF